MIYTHLQEKNGMVLVKDAKNPNAMPHWMSVSDLIKAARGDESGATTEAAPKPPAKKKATK